MSTSKTLKKIRVALSLARIVAINVVAMAIAAMAAVHVYNRQKAPRPAPIVSGILATHPALGAAPTIEIEMEPAGAAPAGAQRAPASPAVNAAIRP
ncbi:MAG: hypothetical protein ABJE95_07365 [Byssovorax sp.]